MSSAKTGVTPASGPQKKIPGGSGTPKVHATEHGDASTKIKVETEEKKKKIRVNLDTVVAVTQDVPSGTSKDKMGKSLEEGKTTPKPGSTEEKEIKVEKMPVDFLSEIPTPPDLKPSLNQLKTENHANSEMKAGVVSFSFKKTGAKLTNLGVFGEVSGKQKSLSNAEPKQDGVTTEATVSTPNRSLMSTFVKVNSKDDIELDWPDEMIQYTSSEPKLSFSCNPLYFDFTQLLTRNKKTEETLLEDSKDGNDSVTKKDELLQTEEQIVIAEREAVLKQVESGISIDVKDIDKKSKKKRKRSKHKKHHIDETQEDKKKHSKKKKKKKKKHKHKLDAEENVPGEDRTVLTDKKVEDTEEYDGDLEVENVDKSKNRSRKKKKSKKSKHKSKKKHGGDQDKENKDDLETPKKIKKSHNSDKHGKNEAQSSSNESDNESEKDIIKRKKKKKKHKHVEEKNAEKETRQQANSSNCIALAEMESAGDLVVEKAVPITSDPRDENKVNSPVKDSRLREQEAVSERKNSSVRKRQTSESSVPETPSSGKKIKLTPKLTNEDTKITKDTKSDEKRCEVPEDSWSKMEVLYECREQAEIQKSKWDTSDSESENILEKKISNCKSSPLPSKSGTVVKKADLVTNNIDHTVNRTVQNSVITPKSSNPGSESGNPGHVTDNPDHVASKSVESTTNLEGQANLTSRALGNSKNSQTVSPRKSRRLSHSRSRKISTHSRTASSDTSASRSDDSYHSRRKRRRSYSKDSYRSHSSNRSYSSSSYSDSHRHSSHSRSRSYSRSRTRSRSRSRRHRSRSYSSYSESDRSSRSRSRSSRRHYSRSRSRSRSYSRRRHSSYSSYSSRSRSRSRSRISRSKKRRRSRSSRRRRRRSSRSASHSSQDTRSSMSQEKKSKAVSPLDIPLPNLEKDDTHATPKKLLQKIKEKKRQNSDLVKKGIAKAKETDKDDNGGYINIPLPMLNDQQKDIEPCDQNVPVPPGFQFQPPPPPPCNPEMRSDDNLEHGGPGSMMAPPPPPPPGQGNYPPPHRMHHTGPRPFMGPLGPGPGPGPGPRFFPPPHRMRPPNHHMGPPPMHNGPGRPPFHRNPYPMRPPMRHPPPMGNHGPHSEQRDFNFKPTDQHKAELSPPPLPPPKSPSPQPPPLPKEEEEKKAEEPTQTLSIVIPPEQAEQYRRLQEQAQKHAKRQLRKQKQDNGEIVSDSSSEEEDDVDKQSNDTMEEENLFEQITPTLIQVPMSHALAMQQPTLVLAQPQPAASPLSGLTFTPQLIQATPQQQILIPGSAASQGLALPQAAGFSHVSLPQGLPLQTGQPIIAVPGGAAFAAAGPQPAHLTGALPTHLHLPGMQHAGLPLAGSHPFLASHNPFLSPGMPFPVPLASHLPQTMLTPGGLQHAALQAAAGGIPQGHVIGHQLIGNQLVRIIRPHI